MVDESHVTYGQYRWVAPVHVWVDTSGSFTTLRRPGLLLGWRERLQPRRGWEAWVIDADSKAPMHGGSPIVRQAWVAAAHVRQATTSTTPD